MPIRAHSENCPLMTYHRALLPFAPRANVLVDTSSRDIKVLNKLVSDVKLEGITNTFVDKFKIQKISAGKNTEINLKKLK